MRLTTSAACALLLAGCASLPSPRPQTPSLDRAAGPLPASVTSDLPRNARPRHYAIEITPDAAAMTFTGRETIDLALFTASRTLTLHANKLVISQALLAPAEGGAAMPLAVSLDAAREQATFTAPAELPAGAYRLTLAYSGVINRQPSGMFAADYPDKRTGKPARALFTQFEVPDAREFAPMFDEPSYKATFDLSAIVPQDQMAVSNMPAAREERLPGGVKRVSFATSPLMSSYLLFFAAGDFERLAKTTAAGTEVGIVSPAGSGETARYSLDLLATLIPYYNDYFGVPFPLPKLDNVAAPGQSQQFGAMENWGAIMTFEKNLLLDANTSPDRQRYMYEAGSHELAHQWFGNLVTMAWWDDLWLNEGFASWFERKATTHFNPGWFGNVGAVNGREAAMARDSLTSTHPIVVNIRTASEADSAFDTISYSKGEAVIAMLEAYAGEDVWRDGVRRYMAAHAYGNATTADLWRAQEQAGAPRIAEIADTFTRQPGVPLVTVAQRCEGGSTRLSLTQGEFSRDRREEVEKTQRRWLVPLTIAATDGSVHRQVLDRSAQVTVPGCGHVIVNGGQNGYFRTRYAAPDLARLTAALPRLDPVDQLGLMSDNLALSAAGYQDYALAIDMLAAVPQAANPVVAKAAVAAWGGLYGDLDQPASQAKLASLARRQWYPRLEQLGFDPRPNDSIADMELRAQLLSTFGTMGDPGVVAEARRRFARLDTNRAALDGPLKTTWLTIAARNATAADWDLLRRLGKTATSSVEQIAFYSQLGTARDDALAQRALDLALTDEPGATTSAVIVSGVAGHHSDLAYDFALAHQAEINAMLDDYSKSSFIPGLARASSKPEMVAKLEALRAARPATQQKPVNDALASLRQRLASAPRIRAQIESWLAAR